MINTLTFEELLTKFKKRGGAVNKYYLIATNKNKQALVYLNGWHKGANIKEALKKALDVQE